ncbi:MAG: sigma-70 family RNA polymerase sigma factor [Acidobacteriia bacterium]|nr:sigma-70 family RNA polymerase sigma factor [Terriglobia bacterium]
MPPDANHGDTLSYADQSQLISRAQSGDGHAFHLLIEPQYQRLYRIAVRITRNHEDAEDACQNGMMNAFIHLRSFNGAAKLSTWLTRVVINEALMVRRKSQTHARRYINDEDIHKSSSLLEVMDQSGSCDPEAICVQSEQTALLWEGIGLLGEKSRLVVCQLGLEESRVQDCAARSHLSRSAVSSRFQRAIKQLRMMLEMKLNARREQARSLA